MSPASAELNGRSFHIALASFGRALGLRAMLWSVNAPCPASTARDFGMWQPMQFVLRGQLEAADFGGCGEWHWMHLSRFHDVALVGVV